MILCLQMKRRKFMSENTKLLRKEIKLAASPLSYFFLAFTLMAFIPGYPILVCQFFICLGLFQTFQNGRESNDIIYSVLLPISKKSIVKARFLFVLFISHSCHIIRRSEIKTLGIVFKFKKFF